MSGGEKLRLLVVEDDDRFRRMMVEWFSNRGFDVEEAGDAETAWRLLQCREFDVAVLDMVMPGQSGIDFLGRVRSADAECEVIMLTGQASVDSAVTAMKLGAYDYLTKPFPLGDLEKVIEKAARQRALSKENRQLKELLSRSTPSRKIIGQSACMQEVLRLIDRAGASDKPILIQGESGTGKELVA